VVNCFYAGAARAVFAVFLSAGVGLFVLHRCALLHDFAELHACRVVYPLDNIAAAKSLFGFPSIGCERQILFYTSLDFFVIAAGYACKIRLV